MSKVSGFKCDVCSIVSDGATRPEHWIAVRLPGSGPDADRDFCSDRCLLLFAKQRAGAGTRKSSPPNKELTEFLDRKGIKPSQRGGLMARHVRARHEMGVQADDCLICEFNEGSET